MKTKWIALILACLIALGFFLGASGTVDLSRAESGDAKPGSEGKEQDVLAGLLLVPRSDGDDEQAIFEAEKKLLNTVYELGEDFDPFADFCAETGALRFIYCNVAEEGCERGYYKPIVDTVFMDTGVEVFSNWDESSGTNAASNKFRGTMLYTGGAYRSCAQFQIFQKPSGALYAVPVMGFGFPGSGGSMTQTFRGDYSTTKDGKSVDSYTEIKLTVKSVNRPERCAILQFDADGKLLARTEYAPEEVPESISLRADTAYLILEQQETGWEGPVVNRTLYQKNETYLNSFYDRGDGICETCCCELIWPAG